MAGVWRTRRETTRRMRNIYEPVNQRATTLIRTVVPAAATSPTAAVAITLALIWQMLLFYALHAVCRLFN